MYRLRLTAFWTALTVLPVGGLAAEPIEAIGAERCGGPVQKHEVDFLAPESTQVQVTSKVMRGGSTDSRIIPALSVDGKLCPETGCGFQATKGQRYSVTAETTAQGFDHLCITVARP
jgi:hypothetical protein